MFSTFDEFHPISNILFQLIENGKKVLDVGCHTGKLGEKLRFEKGCHIVGIEVDKARADVAKHRLNNVIVADAEELNEISYPERFFDVIIFADILEHLGNPKRALRIFQRYLKDGGCIIASIPNVAKLAHETKATLRQVGVQREGATG